MAVSAWRRRFLLDVWAEPRAVDDLPRIIRARVRDMSTDAETFVGSIAEIEAVLERSLDDGGITNRRWERS